VRAVYWGDDGVVATALAEHADGIHEWPGIGYLEPFPIRLIVTRSARRFDSLTAGRVPGWSGAAALPAANTIVIKVGPDPFQTLSHEMAHLALNRVAPRGVPRWFAEGYAARAAGEWGRLSVLDVNWALLRGTIPSFGAINRALRSGPTNARAAYALSTTAILFLERLGGERGLAPLLANLGETGDLDRAFRRTHLLTLSHVEALWQRDVRRRYGWLLLTSSLTLFWGLTAVLVGLVWWRRRRRDRVRKAALDVGWELPSDEPPDVA